MANDVWVYIEHKDGETTPMSFELLGIGKTLANELGSGLSLQRYIINYMVDINA